MKSVVIVMQVTTVIIKEMLTVMLKFIMDEDVVEGLMVIMGCQLVFDSKHFSARMALRFFPCYFIVRILSFFLAIIFLVLVLASVFILVDFFQFLIWISVWDLLVWFSILDVWVLVSVWAVVLVLFLLLRNLLNSKKLKIFLVPL